MSEEQNEEQTQEVQDTILSFFEEHGELITLEILEISETIKGFPAEIALLSKVKLASYFMTENSDGSRNFEHERFERCWIYLNTFEEEMAKKQQESE